MRKWAFIAGAALIGIGCVGSRWRTIWKDSLGDNPPPIGERVVSWLQGIDSWLMTHGAWPSFIWLGLFILLIAWLWPELIQKIYGPEDIETTNLKSDVARLVHLLHGKAAAPENQKDEVVELIEKVEKSKHPAWINNKGLWGARIAFVHWCAVAQHEREEHGVTFHTKDNGAETIHYLNDAAERVQAGLSGKRVRKERPHKMQRKSQLWRVASILASKKRDGSAS